jgi:hypothetical protein
MTDQQGQRDMAENRSHSSHRSLKDEIEKANSLTLTSINQKTNNKPTNNIEPTKKMFIHDPKPSSIITRSKSQKAQTQSQKIDAPNEQKSNVQNDTFSLVRNSRSREHKKKPYARTQSKDAHAQRATSSRAHSLDTHSLTYSLPTHNAFDALSNCDDAMSVNTVSSLASRKRGKAISTSNDDSKKQKLEIKAKPPPITIKRASRQNVIEFMSDRKAKMNDYILKFSSEGVKIHSKDTNAFSFLRDILKDGKAKFFTHLLREDQMTKIVLHGLYNMEIDELKEHLNEADIKPADIKKMSIKNKLYSDHCLYLLYFPKSDKVKISELRETTAINQVRVRWEYFKNKRQGPIQCNRCMSFGHGGKYCFLDPVCIRCGDSHESKDCPHLIDPNTNQARDKINNELVKCGLCGQNHTANYSGCEKRIEFINRQASYRSRTQRRNQPAFRPAPQLNGFNFPAIHQNLQMPAWSHPPVQRQPQLQFQQQLPSSQMRQNQPSSQDLFEPNELLEIFQELMSSLKAARSREEQIYALGQTVIKHCYGSR